MKLPQALLKSFAISALSLATILTVPQASATDRTLNIYNWSDYIDDSVIEDFEKSTGININYDVFDSNEVLETKLLAGSSGYDLVVPSAYFLGRQIEAGVFEKLDKDKLPHLKNMWDLIQERTVSYDPDNAYSINYLWGTTGLGYNEDKIKALIPDAPLDTWKLIFDPQYASKLAECGIYVLDAPTEVIPAALNYLGLDPNVITKETLKKAEAAIEPIRPYIRKFHSSEYISALANGDICLALGWSGDILQASDRAKEADKGVVVKYTIPKEGTQMWFDQMAIPADAKNKAEAYEFMNYIMQPEVIAKVSNYVSYANGNKASQAFIEKDILENPSVFPNKETLERLFTVKTWNAKEQRWANRTWTKIKSGR